MKTRWMGFLARSLVVITVSVFALSACGGDDNAVIESDPTVDAAPGSEETLEQMDEPDEVAEEIPEGTADETDLSGDEDEGVSSISSIGDTVRIGLLNQENDIIGSFPEVRLGIEGAAKYVNAELDGINGVPIEIVTCVQNGIAKAQECAQDLATSDLVSVINGINIWTFAFDFYGTMGETPVIGGIPLFSNDYDQPNARYFNGGSISLYAGMARFAGEQLNSEKVAVLVNSNPAADAAVNLGLKPILAQFGVEVVTINLPLPLTDAITPMSQAVAEGADLIILLATGSECIPSIRAADQLGVSAELLFLSPTCAAAEIYEEVGDLMVGSWIARTRLSKQDPWGPKEVLDLLDQSDIDQARYAPDAPESDLTELGWSIVIALHDLYEEVGVANLGDPDLIFAKMDDGQLRGRPDSFGWSCVYGDIGLMSVCQGKNLFVQIVDADGNSAPPVNDGELVNGLLLLESQ